MFIFVPLFSKGGERTGEHPANKRSQAHSPLPYCQVSAARIAGRSVFRRVGQNQQAASTKMVQTHLAFAFSLVLPGHPNHRFHHPTVRATRHLPTHLRKHHLVPSIQYRLRLCYPWGPCSIALARGGVASIASLARDKIPVAIY